MTLKSWKCVNLKVESFHDNINSKQIIKQGNPSNILQPLINKDAAD